MSRAILCLFLLAGLCITACRPAPPPAPEPDLEPAPEAQEAALPTPKGEPPIEIGDVEAGISVFATLHPDVNTPEVQEVQLVTPKKVVTLSTITVTQPYPAELWLKFRVKASRNFVDRPVAVRASVLRDDEAIGSFSTVIGKYAAFTPGPDKPPAGPLEFKLDAMTGLGTPPETMLVHAEVEVLLLPEGTDETAVDPESAEVNSESRSIIASNPVRINFE